MKLLKVLSEKEVKERMNKSFEEMKEVLTRNGYSFTEETKEDWGRILVFNYKGQKVFTSSFKKGKALDIYVYSNEYSCSQKRIIIK